jgi:hypothetical protein
MIALASQLPPQAAGPVRENGFEAPDHFQPGPQGGQFFPISSKNLEQSN